MFNFFQSIADTIGMIIDYAISLIPVSYTHLGTGRIRLHRCGQGLHTIPETAGENQEFR